MAQLLLRVIVWIKSIKWLFSQQEYVLSQVKYGQPLILNILIIKSSWLIILKYMIFKRHSTLFNHKEPKCFLLAPQGISRFVWLFPCLVHQVSYIFDTLNQSLIKNPSCRVHVCKNEPRNAKKVKRLETGSTYYDLKSQHLKSMLTRSQLTHFSTCLSDFFRKITLVDILCKSLYMSKNTYAWKITKILETLEVILWT